VKAKKKDPPKSRRGEKRIQRAVEQRREKLREAAPEIYKDLSESYETPEGMQSLEDFAIQRDVNRAYGEAHPMQGFTKMTDIGPLMFERWLGKKNSVDGQNYRAPYYRAGESNIENKKSKGGSANPFTETFGGSKKNPTILADDSTVKRYKPGHKQFQTDKPLMKDILGTIGSVFPPANFLLQGGASIGGRQIPEAAAVPIVASLVKKSFAAGDAPRSSVGDGNRAAMKSVPPMAAALQLGMSGLAGTLGDVVIPTSGIGLNPFAREARQIKRETRKDVKNIADAMSRSVVGKTGRIDIISNRETADTDRLIRLYEKKHNIKVKRKESSPFTYQSFMGGGKMKVKKK